MRITHLTPPARGFTRADLCVVLMAVALLTFIALPALAKMKPHSDRVSCANNLRQINLALAMYAADNQGQLPLRIAPSWPTKLLPGYQDLRLLVCPSDGPNPPASSVSSNYPAEKAPRSYIINGWNDYYAVRFGSTDTVRLYQIMGTNAIRLDDIPRPAATVAFGEKENSSRHTYMDFLETSAGDDVNEIEQARHDRSQQTPQTGGSNFAMVDGHVQYVKAGATLAPVNLWAVTDLWRTNRIRSP